MVIKTRILYLVIFLSLFFVVVGFGFLFAKSLANESFQKIVLSVPGPHNLSYLAVELISKIGADREEGVALQLLPVGGGGVALNNLMNRNADFAVAGFPAAMSLRANGGNVVGIASVNDAPLFILMVRAELKAKVKRIADLKGKIIGVNTGSLSSKTTSQQLAELLLKSDGISADQVRILSAGQSWVEQSSLIYTGTVDAIMGDEPFASRLLKEKKVFFLANLSDRSSMSRVPGANFLHAALETRSDVIEKDPVKVQKMVKIMSRTLQWIASHTPQEFVDKLEVKDSEERASLLESVQKYPMAFSRDGSFSGKQLRETEVFFHSSSSAPAVQALKIETMINDKWAGRRE